MACIQAFATIAARVGRHVELRKVIWPIAGSLSSSKYWPVRSAKAGLVAVPA